jgi:hypothetical protein
MKFFQGLFSKKEITLNDSDLGIFKRFSIRNKTFFWNGTFLFLDKKIKLSLSGNAINLDVKAKQLAIKCSNQSMFYSQACDKELKSIFGNADLPFSTWSDSFECDCITIDESTIKISFVDTDFYYFNIIFENGEVVGNSIDH